MIDPLTGSLVAGAVGGVVKAGMGIYDIIHGNQMRKDAVLPGFDISKEYFADQSLAQRQAQSGFSSSARDYYGTQADRGLSAGLDTALQTGGGVNSIAGIYDQYTQANQRFAAEDSQLKAKNLQTLIDANKDMAGQERMKWAIEKYEPYKNLMAGASESIANGRQNVLGGLSGIGASLAAYSTANDADDLSGKTIGEAKGNPEVSQAGQAGVTPSTSQEVGTAYAATSKAWQDLMKSVKSPYLQ